MPTVVNFRMYKSIEKLTAEFDDKWMYVGRGMQKYGLPHSPLHNPFRLRMEQDRPKVADDYREHLIKKIAQNDFLVMETLREIREETVLVCWCAPKLCHASVIIDIWNIMFTKADP